MRIMVRDGNLFNRPPKKTEKTLYMMFVVTDGCIASPHPLLLLVIAIKQLFSITIAITREPTAGSKKQYQGNGYSCRHHLSITIESPAMYRCIAVHRWVGSDYQSHGNLLLDKEIFIFGSHPQLCTQAKKSYACMVDYSVRDLYKHPIPTCSGARILTLDPEEVTGQSLNRHFSACCIHNFSIMLDYKLSQFTQLHLYLHDFEKVKGVFKFN